MPGAKDNSLCFLQKLFVVVPNGVTVISSVVAGDAAPYAEPSSLQPSPGPARAATALLKLLTS